MNVVLTAMVIGTLEFVLYLLHSPGGDAISPSLFVFKSLGDFNSNKLSNLIFNNFLRYYH